MPNKFLEGFATDHIVLIVKLSTADDTKFVFVLKLIVGSNQIGLRCNLQLV